MGAAGEPLSGTRPPREPRLRSRQSEGIFAGDILHHPLQIAYPELCSAFDDDAPTGLQTRLKLLADCAERDVVMMPAHFAEPHCCRIVGRGGKFKAKWN